MDCSWPVPLSVRFPRQEYWSGLLFPSPGDLPDPGMKPTLAGGFFTTEPLGKPSWKVQRDIYVLNCVTLIEEQARAGWLRLLCSRLKSPSTSPLHNQSLMGYLKMGGRNWQSEKSEKKFVLHWDEAKKIEDEVSFIKFKFKSFLK